LKSGCGMKKRGLRMILSPQTGLIAFRNTEPAVDVRIEH